MIHLWFSERKSWAAFSYAPAYMLMAFECVTFELWTQDKKQVNIIIFFRSDWLHFFVANVSAFLVKFASESNSILIVE